MARVSYGSARRFSRRPAWAFVVAGSLALSGCVGSETLLPPRKVSQAQPAAVEPAYAAGVTPPASSMQAPGPLAGSTTIGTGPVKVALILPMSAAGQGGVVAQSMRNAAEMAVSEFQGQDITLLVKDDRGTPEGAQAAAQQALAEGAELIVGPVFSGSVQAAAQVARERGKSVIGFSSDASVATRGVYLLSFLVQEEVDRIVAFAAAQGRRSIAALIPETQYGRVAEARLQQATARHGLRIAALEYYPPGQPQVGVQRLSRVIGGGAPQADALFIPDNGDGMPAVAQALQAAGFDSARVKPLGTGLWNEPRIFGLPALQGGWFAAPDNRGFEAFAERYRARFSADPIRLATLSYDAVTLAAALSRMQGVQGFTDAMLTNPAGFAGADGVFRFNPDGTNRRALTVQEIRNGAAVAISAAPRTLVASGT
ncbi:ABC-type branched-subunit amino acid transport system substrate-binding protein [Microvirga lupini]|uniref:ABC-type branched-subunit amino acid transport system substrate-binding protein n=1 Tax=Microvirga lupini TaxID=420324 RepID=A0A7W4VHT1_9HYPH|nr:penicillin-binding protein activator [Microvirga lupini]MBB3017478.1 ABC-type branched-subunit amino acid transport system substrate-binding protein [Microvirga lupini]